MNKVVEQKFKFWTSREKNCLLVGQHGVGKTSIIREGLESLGYKWGESVAYYSIHNHDFIGDPITAKVILFDDLNDVQAQAAAQEVANLRVWQGKQVHGAVWGAYTLELDTDGLQIAAPPSLTSIFEVTVEVPYSPNRDWFLQEFEGEIAPARIDAALEWWEELEDEMKTIVSPKMLANALKTFTERLDIRDVLPRYCQVPKLVAALNTSPVMERLEQLLESYSPEVNQKFFSNVNLCSAAMKYIPKSQKMMDAFLPCIPYEQLGNSMREHDNVFHHVLNHLEIEHFASVVYNILTDSKYPPLCKRIRIEAQKESSDFAVKLHEAMQPFNRKANESADRTNRP